jgi:hypothetical protein
MHNNRPLQFTYKPSTYTGFVQIISHHLGAEKADSNTLKKIMQQSEEFA